MKVCTDSCLFGAWIANKMAQKDIHPKTILDIGAGTGLLSLMIAQQSMAQIDAIEIDEDAFLQTEENFRRSAWSKRLQARLGDVTTWESYKKYELIISNPPFFENNLKANERNKNIAKHNEGLTFINLLLSIKRNLALDGSFAVLLPFSRTEYFVNLAAEHGFYFQEKIMVKQTPEHSYFRALLYFNSVATHFNSKEIIIKDGKGNYTAGFEDLLRDYYLAFI